MKRLLLIQILIVLTWSMGGCRLPTDEDEVVNQEPNRSSEEEVASEETAAEEQEEEEELVAEEPESASRSTRSVPGLRRSTDPEEFVQARGNQPGQTRNDPFTLFPIESEGKVQPPPPPTPVTPPEQVRETSKEDENNEGLPRLPDEPPPPPQPKLARAVQVQGAVKIGNDVAIIVKAPNEPTSRYVRAQQTIAGGQVLVKRINISDQPTPTVVLEEVGVEVVKPVSGEVPTEAEEAEETAENQLQLPPPPPPSISLQ